MKFLFKSVYAIYLAIITTIIIVPLWLSLYLISPRIGRIFAKKCARALLFLSFCPVKLVNKSYLKQYKTLIFVANHASYIDGLVLLATLPNNTIFIGKKELFSIPVLKKFLKGLGYLSIDKMDYHHSEEDIKKAENALHQHQSIVIFPEGTFRYATGIQAFKLGAFKLAIYSKTAICPIALCGTRQILRSEQWLPTPYQAKVIINEPVTISKKWENVNELARHTRKIIINKTGEPSYMGDF